jgi:hypothetical protein
VAEQGLQGWIVFAEPLGLGKLLLAAGFHGGGSSLGEVGPQGTGKKLLR